MEKKRRQTLAERMNDFGFSISPEDAAILRERLEEYRRKEAAEKEKGKDDPLRQLR